MTRYSFSPSIWRRGLLARAAFPALLAASRHAPRMVQASRHGAGRVELSPGFGSPLFAALPLPRPALTGVHRPHHDRSAGRRRVTDGRLPDCLGERPSSRHGAGVSHPAAAWTAWLWPPHCGCQVRPADGLLEPELVGSVRRRHRMDGLPWLAVTLSALSLGRAGGDCLDAWRLTARCYRASANVWHCQRGRVRLQPDGRARFSRVSRVRRGIGRARRRRTCRGRTSRAVAAAGMHVAEGRSPRFTAPAPLGTFVAAGAPLLH